MDFAVVTRVTGDGLLIGAAGVFDTVTFTITNMAQGGTPQYLWEYWNGGQWAPLTVTVLPSFAVLGPNVLRFLAPSDWVFDVPQDIVWPAGVEQRGFWIRVRTTVAPAGGIPGDSLVEIDMIAYRPPA